MGHFQVGLAWVDTPVGEMVSEESAVGTTWGEKPGVEGGSGQVRAGHGGR